MKLEELVSTARDALTVRRVFAEPYTQDGVTVIAAARVSGGGGGGGGQDGKGQQGEGGGFGVQARPAGMYVIREGKVSWMPAVDVNRLVPMMGFIAVIGMLTRVRLAKVKAKALRAPGD